MRITRRTRLGVVCGLIVVMSAGCAALSPLTSKQETLEERVIHYMQAQRDGKWDTAYSFFDTSYREKETRESYVHRIRKLSYRGFTIEEITMDPSGDQATVKVRIDLSFMGYVFPRMPQTQNWVKEKGAWFLISPSQSRKTSFPRPKEKP